MNLTALMKAVQNDMKKRKKIEVFLLLFFFFCFKTPKILLSEFHLFISRYFSDKAGSQNHTSLLYYRLCLAHTAGLHKRTLDESIKF